MALTAENPRFEPDPWLAEQLRRANACREMADVLQALGRQASVPDTRWMVEVATEVLLDAARGYCARALGPGKTVATRETRVLMAEGAAQ